MNNENKTNINWYPGHMAKTKREIKEKIDLIDIVFEVVDARIPYSSKNKEIEEMTKGKPRVIVMTKIDLCDNVKTNKWIKYYEDRDYIVVPIDLINNPNTTPKGTSSKILYLNFLFIPTYIIYILIRLAIVKRMF